MNHREVMEDLRGSVPELNEDFHAPCPNCGKPLVIRKDQPIRRVTCGCMNQYTIDKRITGQFYLLPVNTEETLRERDYIAGSKLFRSRLFAYVLALVLIVGGLAALSWNPVFVVVGGAAVIAVFIVASQHAAHDDARRLKRKSKRRRKRQPRR